MKRKLAAALCAVAAVAALSGCEKYTERYKDAERVATNTDPAETGTMPDGFSNYATKCDNGNRVYVLFHQDAPYGGIAVVPQDPSCKRGY